MKPQAHYGMYSTVKVELVLLNILFTTSLKLFLALIHLLFSIVMEFADDGDVFQHITSSKQQKKYMKEKHVWKITIQVVRGLRALHELKILHRDMKSANIFLYQDQTAKLGDLNVSKVAKKGLLYT